MEVARTGERPDKRVMCLSGAADCLRPDKRSEVSLLRVLCGAADVGG